MYLHAILLFAITSRIRGRIYAKQCVKAEGDRVGLPFVSALEAPPDALTPISEGYCDRVCLPAVWTALRGALPAACLLHSDAARCFGVCPHLCDAWDRPENVYAQCLSSATCAALRGRLHTSEYATWPRPCVSSDAMTVAAATLTCRNVAGADRTKASQVLRFYAPRGVYAYQLKNGACHWGTWRTRGPGYTDSDGSPPRPVAAIDCYAATAAVTSALMLCSRVVVAQTDPSFPVTAPLSRVFCCVAPSGADLEDQLTAAYEHVRYKAYGAIQVLPPDYGRPDAVTAVRRLLTGMRRALALVSPLHYVSLELRFDVPGRWAWSANDSLLVKTLGNAVDGVAVVFATVTLQDALPHLRRVPFRPAGVTGVVRVARGDATSEVQAAQAILRNAYALGVFVGEAAALSFQRIYWAVGRVRGMNPVVLRYQAYSQQRDQDLSVTLYSPLPSPIYYRVTPVGMNETVYCPGVVSVVDAGAMLTSTYYAGALKTPFASTAVLNTNRGQTKCAAAGSKLSGRLCVTDGGTYVGVDAKHMGDVGPLNKCATDGTYYSIDDKCFVLHGKLQGHNLDEAFNLADVKNVSTVTPMIPSSTRSSTPTTTVQTITYRKAQEIAYNRQPEKVPRPPYPRPECPCYDIVADAG